MPMPIRKIMVLILFAIAVACFAQKPGSTTTTVLEDGREVILHPDSSWSFVKPGLTDPQDDIFLELKDRRFLWLKTDYTWAFAKTMPKNKENRIRDYKSVAITVTVTKLDLDIAFKTSTIDVYNKIRDNLSYYVPKTIKDAKPSKKWQDYLMACIKDDVKENEVEHTHVQNSKKEWKVDAKISLPEYRVQKIIDCFDVQMEPSEGGK